MERQSPIERLRPAAARTIAANARLLELPPQRRRSTAQEEEPFAALSSLPGGVAKGLETYIDRHARPAIDRGEHLAKRITKAHLRGVGPVGDAAELITAEDKRRAVAGMIGSRIGAGLGAAVPAFQPVTIPIGTVVGSWAGQKLYDRYGRQVDEFGRRVGEAAQAELNTLGDQLGRELKRYAPYDLVDRLHRP